MNLLSPDSNWFAPELDRKTIVSRLRSWAGAKDGGADADLGGALFDGDFEIVRHSHRQNRKRQAGRADEVILEFSQSLEIRADPFGILEKWRDAHQTGDVEIFKAGNFFEQRWHGLHFDTTFCGFVFHANFDQDS